MKPAKKPAHGRDDKSMDLIGREMDVPTKIKILFEDNHLIVAIKPAGILSQADATGKPDMLTLLKQDIKVRYGKPGQVFLGLVHRLDQPVSGVMVFARTSKAAARLSAQIREHRVAKYYLAVVNGCPAHPSGSLQDRLSKNPATGQVSLAAGDLGQAAWLDYQVVESHTGKDHPGPADRCPDNLMTLLAIRLGSGRGHQIRVQLASRGWPIVGDRRYGHKPSKGEPSDPALFACLFSLDHPVSGERLHFYADPPDQPPWSWFHPVQAGALAAFFEDAAVRQPDEKA